MDNYKQIIKLIDETETQHKIILEKEKHITELKNIINHFIFNIEKVATKDEMDYITKILTK